MEPTEKAPEVLHKNTQESMSIDHVLEQRKLTYGCFTKNAALSQTLKNTIMQHYFSTRPNPQPMEAYMAEAISMICHKLARIANGDPSYVDSWADIAGYAQLVVNALEQKEGA